MNTEPERKELVSFYAFLALQLARIHNNLYPESTFPKHVRGPRKPDMTMQEESMRSY